jgi:PmbA protein
MVSSTDSSPDSLEELAHRACAMARVAAEDPFTGLAPEKLYASTLPELELCDDAEPDPTWLTQQCNLTEEAALSVKGITNSEGADAGYSRSNIHLVIDNGSGTPFAQSYASSHFSLSVSVLAGEGTNMERDYEYSSTRHRSDLLDAKTIGLIASEKTLKRLNPRKVSTCQAPVIFDPRVSRSLLSTLAGSISGSAIARGASFLKDTMGQDIFAPSITIMDNPHIVRGLGSRPFDGEGVATRKLALVENGVLTSWLLDTRSSNKLGLHTTGHASRGLASPPSPSSTNLYMEAGSLSPAELIADIKSGLYLTETFGMGINTVTGDYSQGAAGFWIENGQIAYPVSEITIAGNLRDMFKQITPANDLTFRYATNAPTLRIESMTIAGT